MEVKAEVWNGYEIRYLKDNGEWWALLIDICNALGLNQAETTARLSDELTKEINGTLVVNELGIYEALFMSKKLDAQVFQKWSSTVLKRLRKRVGLQGYEILHMTDKGVQDDIDHILDTLFWDEENKKLMQSITVSGGDVEQIPFE